MTMVDKSGKKKVVVIGTGGTIAMKRGPDGALVPYQSMKDMIRESPEMRELSKKYAVETIDLLNEESSEIVKDPKILENIGEKVVEAINRKDVDGVVITHGTDTMAYTTQYLDYGIKNLRKPVVLTGSQVAASEPNSDGIPNLKDSITTAAESRFAEVLICFGGEIWGAENAVKNKIWEPKAFKSVDRKPIGSIVDGKIKDKESTNYSEDYGHAYARGYLPGEDAFCETKAWLEPYFDFDGIEEIIARPGMKLGKLMKIAEQEETTAIIMHGFGAGHISGDYRPFFEEARKRGKIVVMCSQAEGTVDLLEYGLGREELEHGVLPAGDRRDEETYMRLAHALGISSRMKKALEERAFQEFLKEKGIELSTQEIARYMFMSDTKFRHRGDDSKYASSLNIPTAPYYHDELRRGGAVDIAFCRAMPLLVNEKRYQKYKMDGSGGEFHELGYNEIAMAVEEKRKMLKGRE